MTFDYREAIHSHIYKYLSTLSIRDRGMKRHDHWVTRNMPCPTVLVEYFFVSNPREAAFGKSAEHIKNMGIATAKGIADALGLPKVSRPPQQTDIWYRVIAGSYRDRGNADAAVRRLKSAGYGAFIEAKRDDEL